MATKAPATARALIKSLPCRPSELPQLHSEILDVLRAPRASAADANVLLTEAHFLYRAQQHLLELNERYFPQSGKSQKEVVAATAARVGFQMPKIANPPEDGSK